MIYTKFIVCKIFNDLNQEINNKFPLDYNTETVQAVPYRQVFRARSSQFYVFPCSVTFFHIGKESYRKWKWIQYPEYAVAMNVCIFMCCLTASQFYVFNIHVFYGFPFEGIFCELCFVHYSHCSFQFLQALLSKIRQQFILWIFYA